MICQEFLLYGIGMSVGGGLGHFEVHLRAVNSHISITYLRECGL